MMRLYGILPALLNEKGREYEKIETISHTAYDPLVQSATGQLGLVHSWVFWSNYPLDEVSRIRESMRCLFFRPL